MAHIDSRTVVVEAVLTEIGRARLANGNLTIDSFALFDDEIDYSLFDPNATTDLQDAKILALPLLEPTPNQIPKSALVDVDPRDANSSLIISINGTTTPS